MFKIHGCIVQIKLLKVRICTRYTVHGRGAKHYPRRECQRPTSRVTLDPRHILEHSLCVHLQAADTVIGFGHVFVNFAKKTPKEGPESGPWVFVSQSLIDLKYDLTVPRISSSDQFHPIIIKFHPLKCFFYKYVFDEYLNMFLEGSETFMPAILPSGVKIRALNYDADPEILTSSLQYPYFDHFLIFSKNVFWGNI